MSFTSLPYFTSPNYFQKYIFHFTFYILLAKLIDQYVVFTPRGSWDTVVNDYSDERIKYTSRMNRNTFNYILKNIRGGIQKQIVNELPISPEMMLAICL